MKDNKIRKLTKKSMVFSATSLIFSAYANAEIKKEVVSNTDGRVNVAEKIKNKKKTLVHFNFNTKVKDNFKIIALPDTNEIIIEMKGVDRSLNLPNVQNNDPLINTISSKLVGDKFLMVIKTKQTVDFKLLQYDKKSLLVLEESEEFKNIDTGEVFKKTVIEDVKSLSSNWNVKKEEKKSIFNEISSINLKKIENKNSKLTIDLNESISPEVTKENERLVVLFKNVSIPSHLQKFLETKNIGTITKSIDVSMQQGNTKLVIEQSSDFEFSTYEVDKKFVIDFKEKSRNDEEETKKYVGKKLSINFQDMEVRAILQVIADFTGLNIMSSDKVTGTMSIRLNDVPWDQALELVLESRGLQKVKDGNVIWVATSAEVKANNEAKIALQSQNTELDPLKLEFFQINYYKAEELKAIIENKSPSSSNAEGESSGISLLSKRGSIGVDTRNNILFIQDTEEKLSELRKIIKKLDVANKQVLVEAKIVIADKKFGQDIGTRFGVKYRKNINGNNLNVSNTLSETNTTNSAMTNLAAGTINGANPGVIGLTLLNMASGNVLGLELSAIEDNNRGKVLSSPRLLTADNKKATIEQGTEIPYATPGTANTGTTISFKKAVLQLDVTPQISPNGKVVLDLHISKDSIGQLVPVAGGGSVPAIDTKKIQTTVTVNNGQTVVLGGVYEIQSQEDIQKIPFLADFPLIGNLFKRSLSNEGKGELMIFITPFIIEENDLDETNVKDVIGNEITLK